MCPMPRRSVRRGGYGAAYLVYRCLSPPRFRMWAGPNRFVGAMNLAGRMGVGARFVDLDAVGRLGRECLPH